MYHCMLLNAPLCFEEFVLLLHVNHSHFPIHECHKQYANKIKHARSWFGLVNQVSNYAQLRGIMAPIKPFLSPHHPFPWTHELDEAFKSSKEKIISSICGGCPNF